MRDPTPAAPRWQRSRGGASMAIPASPISLPRMSSSSVPSPLLPQRDLREGCSARVLPRILAWSVLIPFETRKLANDSAFMPCGYRRTTTGSCSCISGQQTNIKMAHYIHEGPHTHYIHVTHVSYLYGFDNGLGTWHRRENGLLFEHKFLSPSAGRKGKGRENGKPGL